MVSSEVWFPQTYVYTQATEPTDKAEGKLWYNTTDNKTYVSDGTSYVLVADVDLTEIEQIQLEQALNILINSVASSSTLNDWEDMFVDIFSDADGTNDTVDTANTTALFEVDKYKNEVLESSVVDAHSVADLGTLAEHTALQGNTINTNFPIKITEVTKNTLCTATTCYIKNEANELLASATFVGNDATFNCSLSDATTYKIVFDSGGDPYTYQYSATTEFPINDTNFNWTGISGSGATLNMRNVFSVTSQVLINENKLIQANAQVIDADPQGHQLYCHNAVAGTGNITYDISFDGGTTWITDQPINTKNTSVHTGSSMVTKLNLNGVGAGNTAEAEDYAVMLYY